jgi:hypothetical protein
MATVYKIEIETVSAFVAYPEEEVKKILEEFLKNYKDKKTRLGFESTEVKVTKIA